MITDQQRLFSQHLQQFVTANKKECIEKVLSRRTRYVTMVLEDIYVSQNASAVIRTCECMGLQDVHIIESTSKYSINRKVLKGAEKWLTLHRYREKFSNQTETCFKQLRNHGYKIIGTDPGEKKRSLQELDLSVPLAIVMGNELTGLSPYAKKNCDELVTIPMYGFTGSFNISVSAALCLQSVVTRMLHANISPELTEAEKEMLRYEWYKKIVRRSHIMEREFMSTIAYLYK
jgi:tRNA (guanosine-2'-O-)-methyltransferase